MKRARPHVIAHRGASRRARENTLDAFRLARSLGADWVELDVRRSADGLLVVNHDACYADGRAVIDVVADERPWLVPLLSESLEACVGMGVNIEIKNLPGEPGHDPGNGIADALVQLVRATRPSEELLVSSFNEGTVARVREIEPALATAVLTFTLEDPEATIATVAAGGHRAIHPFDSTVDARLVALAHEAGLEVNVWTVDEPARIEELVAFGVDGIVTNVPDVARRALDRG